LKPTASASRRWRSSYPCKTPTRRINRRWLKNDPQRKQDSPRP
jgi:hypothetical protein